MVKNQLSESIVRVNVQNIGGIDEAEIAIQPGVSILAGRNATNRTSFLQALMTGLGSKRSSLKSDADKGSVTVELGDETYTRTLTRRNGTVVFDGNPYLDDPELADLFAFLLESNAARRAVARGDNLQEIIMQPIDTDGIEAEIKACRQKRDDLETEIKQLDELERELPRLEADRREKQEELEMAREELQSVQKQLDELDVGVKESHSRKQELEDAFQRVRDARSVLEDLKFDLKTERSSLSELENEREDLKETCAKSGEPEENLDQITGRLNELRQRKRSLGDTINQLGSVISFNEETLDGKSLGIDDALTNDIISSDPTAALTADDETVCWTCGSEVDTEQIETTLDQLRDIRSAKLDERNEIRTKITELNDRQSELKQEKLERERSERRLSEVESEIESTWDRIDNLKTAVEQKESEVEEFEAEAESIEIEDHDEVLELHREANGIELRIERLKQEIEDIDADIKEREAAIKERESLKQDRKELSDRLTELRTRVDRIEKDAIESFNEHMETVLNLLEYDNLERIWIERRETDVREGRRKVTRTLFDLHIIRTAADGSTYEDTIEHLSESEREVTGLVFALAGYLVHDVDEVVPFIILDSLEAIDAKRIASVVDYFRDRAEYLVAALLLEDAAGLPDTYSYVENIS